MKKWLLSIAVGPVQDFIAAARRTRDLWFGSYLLSEISKAVAKSIVDLPSQNSLIFPAPENPNDLDPDSDFNVGNVILAEIESADNPSTIVVNARQAAEDRWKSFAQDAFNNARNYIEEEIWKNQLDDIVEFYSAWVPLKDAPYKEARRRLMQIMAGRKACRDFKPDVHSKRRPKSSLDGARDSVLKELDSTLLQNRKEAIRLAEGEHLDVVGMTKRIGGGIKSYPSTCRVAADPWIRALQTCIGGNIKLGSLKSFCLANANKLGLARLNTDKWPQYEEFPFDTTLLFPSRYNDYFRETGIKLSNYPELITLTEELKKILNNKLPNPYMAVLVADGDLMGKAISTLSSPEEHRNFSKTLSKFAESAKQIVVESQGCLVYSGGDDVLAMLPLDRCLACAKLLYDSFYALMTDSGLSQTVPTLSVGISIGHFIEPLEDLISWGRLAENAAKTPDRNGLAIHWHSRSGATVEIRGRWDSGFYERMEKWQEIFRTGAVPFQIIYQLRELAKEYRDWPENDQTNQAIGYDLLRLLKRKRAKLDQTFVEWEPIADYLKESLDTHNMLLSGDNCYHAGILQLSNEWWIASQFIKSTFYECQEKEIKIKEQGEKNDTN